jgi:hypothetical protein
MMPVAMVLVVLAVLAAGAAVIPAARAAEVPPLRLTIAFTGDVIGYLEPCG